MITFDILRKSLQSGKMSQTDIYRINKDLHLKKVIIGNIKFVFRPLWGDFILIEGDSLQDCRRCSRTYGFNDFRSCVFSLVYGKKTVEDYLTEVIK